MHERTWYNLKLIIMNPFLVLALPIACRSVPIEPSRATLPFHCKFPERTPSGRSWYLCVPVVAWTNIKTSETPDRDPRGRGQVYGRTVDEGQIKKAGFMVLLFRALSMMTYQFRRTSERVRFPWTRLAVAKSGAAESFNSHLDQPLDARVLEHIILGCSWFKYHVVRKQFVLLASRGLWHPITLFRRTEGLHSCQR